MRSTNLARALNATLIAVAALSSWSCGGDMEPELVIVIEDDDAGTNGDLDVARHDAEGDVGADGGTDGGGDGGGDEVCVANERVASNTCVACAPGTTNDAGDDASGPDTQCDVTVCTADERVASNACVSCPPGTTNAPGDAASGPDTQCDATRCAQDERVASNTCVACAPGTTNDAGDDASGPDTQCDVTVCAADERVMDHVCVGCAPGSGNAEGDDASGEDTTCDGDSCPSNHAVTDNTCVPCPPGTTNPAGDDASGPDTTCVATSCAVDERVASNACVACPPGTTNTPGDDASGPDTQCDATVCAADERVASNTCVACPPGTTNGAGDDASGQDTVCDATVCGENERVDSNVCEACPPGTTNAPGDDASGPDTQCDTTGCAQDERVASNACVACPPGTTNAAGDDASGSDTACDVILCAEDEYVFGNTCVACPPGSTNAAGDDASMGETSCDAILCGVDERVASNTCVACPPGTTNADGDDASDLDTQCDPVLCGADERVASNACVTCPPGQTNDPNDDASMGDTSCDQDPCVLAFGVECGDLEQTYFKASNTSRDDEFGHDVAISGDTMIVSSVEERSQATGVDGDQVDDSKPEAGAVYVFVRTAGAWSQQAYLKASNTERLDQFGYSIAISGDTIAVGAPGEDSVSTGVDGSQARGAIQNDSGAVYVFARAGTTWSQQAYIKASNTDNGDRFGSAVALEGDTLAVGAPAEDSGATGVGGAQTNSNPQHNASGAVYVFGRAGTTWSQQAYIKASNTGSDDAFGSDLALSGDTLVVSAPLEQSGATGVDGDQTDDSLIRAGAVYVFVRTAGAWSQQAYIKASNTDSYDEFGHAVALSGDTLVVSAPYERSRSAGVDGSQNNSFLANVGAAYVFVRDPAAGVWSQQAYLKASNPGPSDEFGHAVAISGDTVAVSSIMEDSDSRGPNGTVTGSFFNSGVVYVFTRSGTTWAQQIFLKSPNSDNGDNFGHSMAFSGATMVVSAPGEDSGAVGVGGDQTDGSATRSGAVYVMP